jgi:hypothetical protein
MAVIVQNPSSQEVREDIALLKTLQDNLDHLVVCDKVHIRRAAEEMRRELLAELGRAVAREEEL